MFGYDDTLADQFHGPLIERAVADILASRRSDQAIRAIVAKAVHEARNRGAAELAFDLRGVEEVAAELGITPRRVRALAVARSLGAKVGKNTWVFRAEDVAAMRERRPGRPANLG